MDYAAELLEAPSGEYVRMREACLILGLHKTTVCALVERQLIEYRQVRRGCVAPWSGMEFLVSDLIALKAKIERRNRIGGRAYGIHLGMEDGKRHG